MAEYLSERPRRFPFWTRLLLYAVLTWGIFYIAGKAKERDIHRRVERAWTRHTVIP